MQVETYECQETAAEPIEACEEAVALMEKLGLEGQKQLVTKTEAGHDQRCPYREMNKDEVFTYRVLCPQSTPLERYSASPIPLRVLQIAAHAKGLDLFRDLYVWHAADATVPDPVLVGMKPTSKYQFEDRPVILARWAESLDTYVTLFQEACRRKRTQLVDQIHAATRRAQSLTAVIEGMTDEELVTAGSDAVVEIRVPRLN